MYAKAAAVVAIMVLVGAYVSLMRDVHKVNQRLDEFRAESAYYLTQDAVDGMQDSIHQLEKDMQALKRSKRKPKPKKEERLARGKTRSYVAPSESSSVPPYLPRPIRDEEKSGPPVTAGYTYYPSEMPATPIEVTPYGYSEPWSSYAAPPESYPSSVAPTTWTGEVHASGDSYYHYGGVYPSPPPPPSDQPLEHGSASGPSNAGPRMDYFDPRGGGAMYPYPYAHPPPS